MKTESGLVLDKILENQNLEKPVIEQAIKFYDEWFDEKYRDAGYPK